MSIGQESNNNNNKIYEGEDSNLLDVVDLFNLSRIAFQVELAFGHAYSMSKSNETIYEADFEAGKVKEIYANYRGEGSGSCFKDQVEWCLGSPTEL